ncbi:hypothetical protein WJX81_004356 [Elliptochloris bilobata]|uniref:Uncharacterized protein n=1 Tax=Elliptochloris bilobata TaxID=381761 RepID=A0AAW1R1T4_9CHLO
MASSDRLGPGLQEKLSGQPYSRFEADKDAETCVPKRRSKLLTVAPFILGNELCERLAYYSIATNLVQYLIDVLGFSVTDANTTVTNWSGACYILPLLGAFLADSYWGRYVTIIVFSIVYMLGLGGITLSAGVLALHGEHAAINQRAFFVAALYIVAIGTGGIKPCVSTFGADQFDEDDPRDVKEKASFFNWFYWSINIGALVASLLVVNLQTSVSWAVGYAVPLAAFGLALAIYLAGTPLYHRVAPGGSALTRIAQVLWAAAVKWRLRPAPPEQLHELPDGKAAVRGSRRLAHTNHCNFLDRAATKRPGLPADSDDRWLYTVTQVEEVKRMASFVPIMLATIVFNTVYAQMSTVFVEQGMTMDLRMGKISIASASLSAFDTIAIIVLIPLYDWVLAPWLRWTYLQRIGWGLVVSTFSMVAAAVVEVVRLRQVHALGLENSKAAVPISVFWLVPQYFIVGAAEILVNIGTMELFYSEAPDAMRSTASALQLVTTALGNYVATGVTMAVTSATTAGGRRGWLPDNLNQGRLDLYYTVLVLLSAANMLFFLVVAHFYQYKKKASGPHQGKCRV